MEKGAEEGRKEGSSKNRIIGGQGQGERSPGRQGPKGKEKHAFLLKCPTHLYFFPLLDCFAAHKTAISSPQNISLQYFTKDVHKFCLSLDVMTSIVVR